jgi:hypothetical protein
MATYYVSNAASNGYAAGNDGNNGTARATPFLTIDKATSLAGATDTVVVNPSGTPYVENSAGSGWLELRQAGTVTGDPALAGAATAPANVPVIQASAASRVINVATTPGAQTLACVTLDAQNGGSRVGLSPHQSPALTLSQVNFRNVATWCISSFNAGSNLTLDRVSMDASCTQSGPLSFTGLNTLTVLGGQYDLPQPGNNGAFYFNNVALAAVTLGADLNGALPYFGGEGATYPTSGTSYVCSGGSGYSVGDVLTLAGGTASQTAQFTVDTVDGSGRIQSGHVSRQGNYTVRPAMPNAPTGGTGTAASITLFPTGAPQIYVNGGSTIATFACSAFFDRVPQAIRFDGTVTSWTISGSTFNDLSGLFALTGVGFTCTSGLLSGNSFTGLGTFVQWIAENAQGVSSKNNAFHALAGSRASQASVYWATGSSVLSTDDSLAVDAGAFGGFVGGSDGYITEASQFNSTRSASLNLGDTGARTYIATMFTTSLAASSSRSTHLAAVKIEAKRVGNGQSCTLRLYGDNAGLPGTLLGTSDVIGAATFPTSPAFMLFTFSTPTAIAANTRYHLRWETPAIDAANYLQMSLCSTVSGPGNNNVEYVRVSPDGASWTSDTGHSFEITVLNGWYGHTPTYKGTVVSYGDANDPNETEGINSGPCLAPLVDGGRFINAGYGALLKNARGGTIRNCFQRNGANKGPNGGLYLKAVWNGPKVINNTVIVLAGNGVILGGDSLSVQNHAGTVNPVVENNVIVATTNSGTPYQVDPATVSGAAIDYNCLYRVVGSTIEQLGSYTQAGWQALGYDAHSLWSDPQLANETASAATFADATPLRSSPVIGKGTDLRASNAADANGLPWTQKPAMGCVEFMTGELFAIVGGAATLYAVVRNAAGLAWNGSGFEAYAAANLASYALGMGQQGSSGAWSGSMPVAIGLGTRPPRGRYFVDYRVQAGAAPAESDTIVGRGKLSVEWDGSAEMLPVDPRRIDALALR